MRRHTLFPWLLRSAALLSILALSACAAVLPASAPPPTGTPEPTPSDTPGETPTATLTPTRPPPTAAIDPTATPTRTPTVFATSRIPTATPPIERTQGPTRVPLPTSDFGGLPDLCGLVPVEEVAALAGEAVASASPSPGSCLYTFARTDPAFERAIGASAAQGNQAKEALISLVLLFGALAGSEDILLIVEELEGAAPTMTLLEVAEASSREFTSLGYVVEDIPGLGDWAIWLQYPDPPIGVLLAVQGETLVLVTEAGMDEAVARDASAALAQLLFDRLPLALKVAP